MRRGWVSLGNMYVRRTVYPVLGCRLKENTGEVINLMEKFTTVALEGPGQYAQFL